MISRTAPRRERSPRHALLQCLAAGGVLLLLANAVDAVPQQGAATRRALLGGTRVVYFEEELRAAPAARDVWALIEHRVPTVVSARLDVGGSETGIQGLFSARGTAWSQNVFRLDGIDTTDPSVRGTSAFHYDLDALQSLVVTWGGHDASVAGPGISLDMVLASGADEPHAGVQGYFELDKLQADGDQSTAGVAAGAIDFLSDVAARAGGPLATGKAWLFASYRDARVSRFVPAFADPVRTDLPIVSVKLSAVVPASSRWSVSYTRQRYRNPARGAAAGIAPEATAIEDNTVQLLAGQWRGALGDSSTGPSLRLRAGYLDVDFPLRLQEGSRGQSRLDIVSGTRSGAPPLFGNSRRRRYSVDAEALQRAYTGGVAHDWGAGFQYRLATSENAFRAVDDVNLVTSGGRPLLAQLLNTPVVSRQDVRSLGVFVHDDLGSDGRWNAQLGIRIDDHDGRLPAQQSPAGSFVTARSFADRGSVGWRGLGPRAALAVDVFGDGRAHVVVGFAQYVHHLGTSALSLGNANAVGVAVVPWTDIDGDGRFQPGEGGPPSAFGDGAFAAVDAGMRSPRSRELRAGISHDLGGAWTGSVDLWYRKDTRLFDAVEIGLQPADFSQTIVLDPGRDNVAGTADDGGIAVFNQEENFGGNRLLLTSETGKRVTYRGMDLGLRRPLRDNWQLDAVLTLGLAEGPAGKASIVPGDSGGVTDLFRDPNGEINADGRLFWDRPWNLKVAGSYALPRGIVVAGALRSWAGSPRARILPVPLNQGLVNVFAEPRGALREDAVTTVDLSVSKSLSFTRRGRLTLILDVFNALDAATITATREAVPLFGTPAAVLPPRVARLGARVEF